MCEDFREVFMAYISERTCFYIGHSLILLIFFFFYSLSFLLCLTSDMSICLVGSQSEMCAWSLCCFSSVWLWHILLNILIKSCYKSPFYHCTVKKWVQNSPSTAFTLGVYSIQYMYVTYIQKLWFNESSCYTFQVFVAHCLFKTTLCGLLTTGSTIIWIISIVTVVG